MIYSHPNPNTYECDFLWKWDLCRCISVKDLEMGSSLNPIICSLMREGDLTEREECQVKTEAEIDWHCHKPGYLEWGTRMAGATRSCKSRERVPPPTRTFREGERSSAGDSSLPPAGFWTAGFQNSDLIFCCLKQPGLWWFVATAPENYSTHIIVYVNGSS